jgi:hypothetical protein
VVAGNPQCLLDNVFSELLVTENCSSSRRSRRNDHS